MTASYAKYKIGLCALFLALGLTTIADLAAVAQETETSQPLERVDVEAPERRAPARATTAPRSGADYDEPSPPGPSSDEDRGGPSQVFSGSGIPSSTLSLVTDKSQVSLGAASLPAQVQTISAQDIQQLNLWGREPADLFMKIAGINSYYRLLNLLSRSCGSHELVTRYRGRGGACI